MNDAHRLATLGRRIAWLQSRWDSRTDPLWRQTSRARIRLAVLCCYIHEYDQLQTKMEKNLRDSG